MFGFVKKPIEKNNEVKQKVDKSVDTKRVVTRNRVQLSLNDDQFETIKELSNKLGLAHATLCKGLIFSAIEEKRFITNDSLSALVYEVKKLGVNLNQLAHVANQQKAVSNVQLKQAFEIWQKVEQLIEKELVSS